MMTDPQLDPMGSLILELRGDIDVAVLVSDRVRGGESGPGDVQPTGKYKAFIRLVTLSAPPERHVPITFATYAATCYGATGQNAWAVYAALAKALHMRGPRVKTNGLGIYETAIISGGEQGEDPDTKQPTVQAVISLIATTQAVAD